MAKKRLALVACKDAAEGPWTLAKQNETDIKVMLLGQGESVVLEMSSGNLSDRFEYFKDGTYPWPNTKYVPERYRIIKEVDNEVEPARRATCVEVFLSD